MERKKEMTRKKDIKPIKHVEHDLSIKNFVISTGRILVDLSALICMIAIICVGVANQEYSIIIIPVGLIVMVIVYYLLYLAIDVRDNLVALNMIMKELNINVKELNEGLLEEETEIEEEPQKIS